MSAPCEKHALLPVVGQSPCAGCEIERLMAENERLVRRDKMLAEVGCEYCGGSGWVHRIDGECLGACDECPAYELSCTKHERDQLKAENAGLHAQVDTLAERHASALCEIEALRKDVDRYRFIRTDVSSGKSDICIIQKDWRAGRDTYLSLEKADYVIDAAMAKAPLANPGQ